MKKLIYTVLFTISSFLLIGCGIYGFTGGDVGNAKTIQVDFFPNQAQLIEPTLSQQFTNELQDLFTRQTNLSPTPNNGDLHFSGEITSYRIAPMSATSAQTSAQNRLTITVNVRYINNTDEKKDFEKSFSFYSDYPATSQLTGSVQEAAFEEIIDRITQDIFNASVGKW
ncbi:LptE family protein [Polaribacter sp. KT 15]|uniref:LptE family protein n=1 Tax=Polaribacter sp. KT 15 TaxID=1896175 RepID=UPI00090BBE2D|nr:LptE family protein [Polaribacter sp. KT 15]SHM98036.1 Lipopolysaccharide-assembly [Polaribacter sp. KT 15]